jgi:WD40 repeat protein
MGDLIELEQSATGTLRVPSHNGRWWAEVVGATGEEVEVREIATGRQVKTFRQQRGRVYALAWSPDDEYLALGGLDSRASVIPVFREGPALTYSGHRDWVIAVAFSPARGLVASGSFDRTVQVWVGPAGNPFQTKGQSRAASATPDFAHALIQSGRIPGQRLATYEGHRATVYLVAFAPDSRRVVSADLRGEVHVWSYDVVTGAAVRICKLVPEGYVEQFTWSPDGANLALCTAAGQVEIWDMTTGQFRTAFHTLAQIEWLERPSRLKRAGASYSPAEEHL